MAGGKLVARGVIVGVVMSAMFALGAQSASAETCDGLTATIVGTNIGETIQGSSAGDVIQALGGNDTIYPMNGDDHACGQDGLDTIDEITTSSYGIDSFLGGPDADILHDGLGGGGGFLFGNGGDDAIYAWIGDDQIEGGPGADYMAGLDGNDIMLGHDGADTIYGDQGNDDVYDGNGVDELHGGSGTSDDLWLCDTDNSPPPAGFEATHGPSSSYCF